MKGRYFAKAAIVFSMLALSKNVTAEEPQYWPTAEWRISVPEEQGIDSKSFELMNNYIREKIKSARSILIIRHGYVVFEQYYSGTSQDLVPLLSVSKSVISLLLGITIDKGFVKSIDERMLHYFPEYAEESVPASVTAITLRQLLTMSSGIGGSADSPDPYYLQSVIARFKDREPAKGFQYNNMDPCFVSMIITRVAGQNTLEFAKANLFLPLGINNVSWGELKDYPGGSTDLSLSPRDMAKIGFLYLHKGKWEDRQIVSAEWVKESTNKQIEIPERIVPKPFEYGFFWWKYPVSGHYSYHSYGRGGQIIMVIPDLDMVFVATSKNMTDEDSPLTYLPERFIVKAVIK